MAKRVVLAYSGGLDTSVAVRWLIDELGYEVVCLCADVGQEGNDWEPVLERARAAGYGAMILTVDSQVSGLRERDLRNGLPIPPTIRPRTAVEGLTRPSWALGFARCEQLTFANVAFSTGGSSVKPSARATPP